MPGTRVQNRQQAGGLIRKVNYGELTIILTLLLSLAGMTTCAIGLKIEQRVQRDAFISKRNIFIPLMVIWAVSQVTFMVTVCVHLARIRSLRYQSCGPTHPVPNYILRTVGLILLTTILHLTISSFSAEGDAAEICSWIPLFCCASAVGNAIVGNGTDSNLLTPHPHLDHDDSDEEEHAHPPAQQQSQQQGPSRQTMPPSQQASSAHHNHHHEQQQQQQQQQQQLQDSSAQTSTSGTVGTVLSGIAGGFAQGIGGDAGQGLSS